MNIKLTHAHPSRPLGARPADRWEVTTPERLQELAGGRWTWFKGIQNRQDIRFNLNLAYDSQFYQHFESIRPVVVKTLFYRSIDRSSALAVEARRLALLSQIDVLNHLSSPLLPEPLDLVYLENDIDGLPASQQSTEPALVLEWVHGHTVAFLLDKHRFRFPNDERTRRFGEPLSYDNDLRANIPRIARICQRIVRYLRLLDEREVVCFDLNPQHIILGADDIPRFVGLGSLSRYGTDPDHPNFCMTTAGYAPREVNDPANEWRGAREATAASVGCFALGACLLQMVAGLSRLPHEWIRNGTLEYPNRFAEKIVLSEMNGRDLHHLLRMLLHPSQSERLADFGIIEDSLAFLASAAHSVGSDEHVRSGRVEFFDEKRNCGSLIPDDNKKERIYFSGRTLGKSWSGRAPKGGDAVRYRRRVVAEGLEAHAVEPWAKDQDEDSEDGEAGHENEDEGEDFGTW